MTHKRLVLVTVAVLVALGLSVPARATELDDLKASMQAMQKQMEQMQKKIVELEQENNQQKKKEQASRSRVSPQPPAEGPAAATHAVTDANGNQVVTIAPTAVTLEGHASQVIKRPAVRDEQEAAPRPNDLTLDPKYRGFIPVPNTPVLIKFNAHPRVDLMGDSENSGDPDRFVTARIPVEGDFFKGGGHQFNINAKGSRLSIDVRAPAIDGNPRFFYQNDFFGGSGGEFPLRVRHLYGEFYNFVFGQTTSVFEDPDAWPDTVDYEGVNSIATSRRPLIKYLWPINDHWQVTLGLEKPGAEVDTTIDPDASSVNHAPDGGFNVRWEDKKIGHVQFSTILRDIGVKGPITGDQSTFGWGVNLGGAFNIFDTDSIQVQATYGEGIFRYINDDFVNNDAALDTSGNLKAIPFFGALVGYTHKWTDTLRTTASYGYAHLDNEMSQGPNAYHITHYGSLNLVWQVRKRLSIGVEGLYGRKEVQSGADGDVFRLQLGVVYSLFD
jgi:hypothetical protein